jgi:uncharacterized protein (TIGR02246 family)
MKTIIISFVLLFIYHLGFAQSATDEKAVRAVIQTMEDAWNAHDFNYSGQYDIFDQHAILINPVGMYWKNKAEIVKAHQVFGEMMFKHTSTKNQQVDVRFLAPTVALAAVKVQYRIEQDHNLPNGQKAGSKGDTNQSMLSIVLTKKNESWKIASLQVTEVNQNAQASDPIKK